MAENKKGFILYADQRSIIDMLDNETAGVLFKHIFAYVNDENPKSDNPLLNLAFEPIKLQLKRDLKHWETVREGRSKAGKASANKRQQMSTNVDFVEQTSTNPTVIVKDTVIVNVIDIEKELLTSQIWHEDLRRHFKIQNDQLLIHLRGFIQEQKAQGRFDNRVLGDLKRHFVSWGNLKKIGKPEKPTSTKW